MLGAGEGAPIRNSDCPKLSQACDLRALRQPAMHPKNLWKEGDVAVEVADPAIFSSPSSYLPRQKTDADARKGGRRSSGNFDITTKAVRRRQWRRRCDKFRTEPA